MFYYFFAFISVYLQAIQSQTYNCTSFDSSNNLCYGCASSHYQENQAYGFAVEKCREKNNNTTLCQKRNILITYDISSCTDCSKFFDQIYEQLGECLKMESSWAADFDEMYIIINLLGAKHSLHSSYPIELRHLFRRSKVKLVLKPLFCDEYLITGCFERDQYVEIILRSTDFIFYVAASFSISNILFNGIDLTYKGNDKTCWDSSSEYCCPGVESIIYSDWNQSNCGIRGLSISNEEISQRGLFNLESVLDDPVLPTLVIDSCIFKNFFLVKNFGFGGLIKINTKAPIQLNLLNSTIDNFFSFASLIGANNLSSLVKNDPFYKFSLINLQYLIDRSILLPLPSSSSILLQNNNFKNRLSATDIGIALLSTPEVVVNLKEITCLSVSLKNLRFENISDTHSSNYLLRADSIGNASVLLENIFVVGTINISLLNFKSISYSLLKNISLSLIMARDSQILAIDNSSLNISGLTIENSSSLQKSSLMISILPTAISQVWVVDLTIRRCDNFLNSFSKSVADFSRLTLENITFTSTLFSGYDSSLRISDSKFYQVIATGATKSIIFFMARTNLSMVTSNIYGLYSNNIFDFRDVPFCLFNSSILEKLNGILFFFTIDSTFRNFTLNSSRIANSSLERFSFWNVISLFANYRPTFLLSNSKIYNLEILYGYFSAFSKFDLKFQNCELKNWTCAKDDSIVRFFYFGPQSSLKIADCLFESNGFTYMPAKQLYVANQILILGAYMTSVLVMNSKFINDERVNLISGYLGLVYTVISIEITNCTFEAVRKNPKYTYHGVIMGGAPSVKFVKNTVKFLNCPPRAFLSQYHINGVITLQGEESLRLVPNTKTALVENNTFIGCKCYQAGAMSISNYISTVRNNVFSFNEAEQAGSLAILSTTKVFFLNNSFDNSKAILGGALTVYDILNMEFRDSTIRSSWGNNTGGVWINNILNITFININAVNVSSTGDSGFMTIIKSSLFLYNCSFLDIASVHYAGLLLLDQFASASLLSIKIKNSSSEYGGVGALISAESFLLVGAEILDALAFRNGGALFFDSLLFVKVAGLSISSSASLFSGLIFIKTMENDAVFEFENLSCFNNKAGVGSCIYYNSPARLSIKFANMSACQGQILKFTWSVKTAIFLSDLVIHNNTSMESLILVQGLIINISRVILFENSARKSLISVKNCDINLSNLFMRNNENTESSALTFLAGLQIVSASLNAENIVNTNLNAKGDFVFILTDGSMISVEGLYIYKTTSVSKSILYFEKSSVMVRMAYFENNTGISLQGVYGSFNMSQAAFIGNTISSLDSPSDISITRNILNKDTVELKYIFSIRTNTGMSTRLSGISSLLISFLFALGNDNKLLSRENSQEGVSLQDSGKVFLSNSVFSSLGSYFSGGALKSINMNQDPASIVISETEFVRCSSLRGGGAIFISNALETTFTNCKFILNEALFEANLYDEYSGVGGCGLISCFFINCLVNFFSTCFEANTADFHSPLFVMNTSHTVNNITLANNSDIQNFTTSFTVYPLDVKINIDSNFILNTGEDLGSRSKLSLSEFISGVNSNYILISSGIPFNLTFEITDKLGQDLIFEDSSRANLDIDEVELKIAIYNSLGVSENGKIYFRDTSITALPGLTIKTKLTIMISKYVGLNEDPLLIEKTLYLKIQTCIMGEIITSVMTCHRCPKGTYSIIDPMKDYSLKKTLGTQKCLSCPLEALCPGGWQIFPKPGFWRSNNDSLNFIPCLVPETCTGPSELEDDVEENQVGKCKHGHFGNQCYSCIVNHGRMSTTSTCEDCEPAKGNYVFKFIGTTLLVIAYAVGGSYVYSFQSEKAAGTGYLFVIIKIMVSFSQIVNLLTSLKFNWVVGTFKDVYTGGSNTVSFSFEYMLLNDCIIQKGPNGYVPPLGQFKLKLGIIVLLPIILASVSSLLFILQYFLSIFRRGLPEKRLKVKRKLLIMRIFACLVISIFIFQPIIIRNCFDLLNCSNFDPGKPAETFVNSNPNIQCWDSDHASILLFSFLPGVFIWGLGFPIILIIVLRTQQVFKLTLKTRKINASISKDLGSPSATVKKVLPKIEPEVIYVRHKISLKKDDNHPETRGTIGNTIDKKKTYSIDDTRDLSPFTEIPSSSPKKGETHRKGVFYFLFKSNVFRFLHHGFKENLTFWEGVVFLKKFLISMLVNMTSIIGLEVVNLIIFLILFTSLFLHFRFKPFVVDELNFQESVSQVCCLIVYASVIALSTNLPGSVLPDIAAFLITFSFLMVIGTSLVLIIKSLLRIKLINRVLKPVYSIFSRKFTTH